MWCISFNSVVEYDFQKFLINTTNAADKIINQYIVDSARELLDYALSEKKSPTGIWGVYKNSQGRALLPNPFCVEDDLKHYIKIANNIFSSPYFLCFCMS